jgi:MFS family permease
MNSAKKTPYQNFLPYLVWFFGAIFFLVDYIVRVSPSVLTPTLMQTFHADAFTIGGFSGFFYYAYICMQIPVGILVDRFGPRRLLIASTLICSMSTFMFAGMHSIEIGFISRFMMGFGAAFAFVGTLKLISIWFKSERFALLAGITQAMGMVGATIGQGPMATLYQNIGWRPSMYGLAIFFVVLCLLIIIFVKDTNPYLQHADIGTHKDVKVWPSLKVVLMNPQTWLNCLFVGLLYAPSACFGEQWGASFLSASQGIGIDAAGHETGIMFIGLAIGCPVLGWVSDHLKRRLLIMRISVVMCLLLLTIVIYGNQLPFRALLTPNVYTVILFIYGFFNSGIVPSYAMAAEINPRQLTGMALGITNMASVIVGAIMIPIVGYILDHLWTGQMLNGARVFDISEYQIAFAALPIGFVLAFFISFFQKETYCRHFTHGAK